jgi:hypothetical protein
MKYIFVLLLLFSACSTFSTKRPIAGDDTGFVAITLYKPVPDSGIFASPGKIPILMSSPNIMDYVLISVSDYLELAALIQSCQIWNRRMFTDYCTAAKAPIPTIPLLNTSQIPVPPN